MKTAIITGAAGNLGEAVCKKFLDSGYRVAGTVSKATNLFKGQDSFSETIVDLTDENTSADFVNAQVEKSGTLDAAVLTVGGFQMGNVAESTASDMQQQYRLNFMTAYNVARPVFLQMMKQGAGRIFFIGSRPGSEMRFGKGMIAYALSKSLLFNLAQLLNDEAKGKNVVVAVIVPSTIDTAANREGMKNADYTKWVKPQEIADIIYYHCTDEASVLRESIIKVYNNA